MCECVWACTHAIECVQVCVGKSDWIVLSRRYMLKMEWSKLTYTWRIKIEPVFCSYEWWERAGVHYNWCLVGWWNWDPDCVCACVRVREREREREWEKEQSLFIYLGLSFFIPSHFPKTVFNFLSGTLLTFFWWRPFYKQLDEKSWTAL